MKFLAFLLLSAFTLLTCAAPFPGTATPPEAPSDHRRGVAYNNPDLVHLFPLQGGHVGWCYNWDSRTGPTETPYEFVPMLHSLRPEHVSRWRGDAERAIYANKDMPTHVLAFNEPDNCE
jgi:hypothetical protein